MTHPIGLCLAAMLGLSAAGASAPEGIAPPTAERSRPHPSHGPAGADGAQPEPDPASDEPPPTAYDLQGGREMPPGQTPERTLIGQLLRTVLALALVILLIVLFAKVALPRIFRVATVGSGKHIRVLERAQLDGRHALFVVQVGQPGHGQTVLLGIGERGVQMLAELDGVGPTAAGEDGGTRWKAPFAAALSAIAGREGYRRRPREGYDESQRMGEDDR